mmetsp:Transcript_23211/g.60387  ORF Transcript_23211/g.60387 Transcript_23211/m.60387 type:complete len:265 (+) Transcript_23211:34-828(+)
MYDCLRDSLGAPRLPSSSSRKKNWRRLSNELAPAIGFHMYSADRCLPWMLRQKTRAQAGPARCHSGLRHPDERPEIGLLLSAKAAPEAVVYVDGGHGAGGQRRCRAGRNSAIQEEEVRLQPNGKVSDRRQAHHRGGRDLLGDLPDGREHDVAREPQRVGGVGRRGGGRWGSRGGHGCWRHGGGRGCGHIGGVAKLGLDHERLVRLHVQDARHRQPRTQLRLLALRQGEPVLLEALVHLTLLCVQRCQRSKLLRQRHFVEVQVIL